MEPELDDFLALNREAPAWFGAGSRWIADRAPGRLDVLGGVADYSGGLVVEKTVREGVSVAAAADDSGTCTVRTLLSDPAIDSEVSVPADVVFRGGSRALGDALRRSPRTAWAAYALGPAAVLAGELGLAPRGLRLLVASSLSAGAGLASSAALEVAALRAAAAALGVAVARERIPPLAQRAEHEVARAPCGLMDQVAVCEGEEDALLPLLCRPMTVLPLVRIPAGVVIEGVPSGVRHSVGGAAYRRARAAAFMGKTLLGLGADAWLAALGDADPCLWTGAELPVSMTGAEFLARHGSHGDPLTSIDPAERYPVRAATAHPILETARSRRFLALLSSLEGSGDRLALLAEAGAILNASHASYGAMGLGCPETDALHNRLLASGALGARVSGGGSGGTLLLIRCQAHN